MPEQGNQFDDRTTSRLVEAMLWVERQRKAEVHPEKRRAFPIGTLRRFGITCPDPDTGVYPKPADKPNTYWFKFYVETHDLAQGAQARTGTWLDDFPPPNDTYPDGYWICHNYTDDSPATKSYVPEGSLVLLSWHNERWWFQYQREEFWGRIIKADVLATGQWKYTFSEVYKGTEAYGGWVDVAGGRSGYLYNSVEEVADPTAVAIPLTAVVEVHVEYWDDAGTVKAEYWCQYEEFDQTDASSGGFTEIDVLICEPYTVCTRYIHFPQRRLYLPPGTRTETLPDGVVALDVCDSSDPPPPENGGPPSDSTGDPSSGSAGQGWTDGDIVWPWLLVEVDPDPLAFSGGYSRGIGYYNGRPFWFRFSAFGTFLIWWNPMGAGFWQISKIGDSTNFWYKKTNPDTPLGYYTPSVSDGPTATVSIGGV